MPPHLLVSISGHGFGHVAQTTPVLNALHKHYPQLRLTVRSGVASAHLRSRIHAPFTHLPGEGDIGMLMNSPLSVDVEKSRAAYRAFHADWTARIANEAQLIKALHADMVLSNVGYLPLAGAQRAGIPNAALCSLNWADIYRHYCGENEITRQIQSCYAGADIFFRATPGMAMTDLPNLLPVLPIADIGENCRDQLNPQLKLSRAEKLILVSMGGIRGSLAVENWPRIDGVRYLVQQKTMHPDAIDFTSVQLSFSDLLASSDVLLCKPGYGSFVEAVCAGIPVLYVERPDWPESPALIAWLQQQGTSREIPRDALHNGDFKSSLSHIAHKQKTVVPAGAKQVADWIANKLFSG